MNEENKILVGPWMTVKEFADMMVRVCKEQPEPKPSPSFPDERTRAAAEDPWPRDRYSSNEHDPNFEIAEISDGIVTAKFLWGAESCFTRDTCKWTNFISQHNYRLLSRGPDPKAEALKDGDVEMGEARLAIRYSEGHPTFREVSVAEDLFNMRKLFNLNDLAAHIRSGGRLLYVKPGEVGVAMSKEEAKSLTPYLVGSIRPEFNAIGTKLVAALAQEGKE